MTEPGNDKLEAALRVLRLEYLSDSTRRVAELWSAFARIEQGDAEALSVLRMLAHRIAGTGGAYGLPAATDAARELDQACRALIGSGIAPTGDQVTHLRPLIERVSDAFGNSHGE